MGIVNNMLCMITQAIGISLTVLNSLELRFSTKQFLLITTISDTVMRTTMPTLSFKSAFRRQNLSRMNISIITLNLRTLIPLGIIGTLHSRHSSLLLVLHHIIGLHSRHSSLHSVHSLHSTLLLILLMKKSAFAC